MSEFVEYATQDEVEADLAAAGKPIAYSTAEGFPFSLLTDRQFECLLHDIAIALPPLPNNRFGDYERAALMQGVGERGRDVALIKGGKHVGAIQCKRYQGLVTKPDAAREIIKYCLHALKDPELMPQPLGFRYIFAASKDFNEKAKALLNAFPRLVDQEMKLLDWTGEVIEEYKSLSDLDPKQIQPDLLRLLTSIEVVPIGFSELNTLLVGQTSIISKYFSVRTVVDDVHIRALDAKVDLIARSLGDKETRRLIDSFNAQPADRRLDFGLFSLWGYPRRFIEDLVRDGKLRQARMLLAKAKADLDAMFIDHLTVWVDEEILAHVTATGLFSPLVIFAGVRYLHARVFERWRRNQQGATLTAVIPRPSIPTDAISVRKHVLDLGQDFLNNDWSKYVGDEDILALKRNLARQTFKRYADLNQMERTFDAEWPRLEPILDRIEVRLEAGIPTDCTIVLRSMRWFDDKSHVIEVFSTAVNLDKDQ